MAPALNPRSLLFTLYGDYVHPGGQEELRVSALVRLAADLDVSGSALRSALSRMTHEGWLEASRGGGRPRYRLSARGRQLIEEGTRRIYGRHRARWDGHWLVVSYSLPEGRRGERDRLRQGLNFLGLGSLGNGLYVTPHDLRQEVRQLAARCKAEHVVTIYRGHLEWPTDPHQLVGRAWNLDAVRQRYEDFLTATRQAAAEGPPADDREAFRRRFLLTHEFRRFPFSDPDLPDDLLPDGWVGQSARALFLDYNRKLRRQAERYYRSVAFDRTVVDNSDTKLDERGA